ncbi:hypothetical protein [Enterococcus sp. UD-01]|jgi:hypothetical protein|uniref:hypothetical protein n=1 Tax=Enterococcus sp. UD-01 TaxID=3373911 RepID=UPI0038396E9E
MNSSILWNELKSSDAFLDLSKKLEIKYDVPQIGYCGSWLIRDNYNKPFIADGFTSKGYDFRQLKKFDEAEVKKDQRALLHLYEELMAEGTAIIAQLTEQHQMSTIWNSELSLEENNERLEKTGFASYDRSFVRSIRVRKNTYFSVCYGNLKANQKPYFSTSAFQFNRLRTDYEMAGQAQNDLLMADSTAFHFFTKWDKFHTCCLTISEYEEMRRELKELERRYETLSTSNFDTLARFERQRR